MKIGELAEAVGIGVETIRFYETKGLMPPPARTAGNFRDYTEAHLERLNLIRHCRWLDMSLDEIQVLLDSVDRPDDSCVQVNELLDAHMAHVAQRIAELKTLHRTLHDLRHRCEVPSTAGACGILQGLSRRPAGESLAVVTHLQPVHGL